MEIYKANLKIKAKKQKKQNKNKPQTNKQKTTEDMYLYGDLIRKAILKRNNKIKSKELVELELLSCP